MYFCDVHEQTCIAMNFLVLCDGIKGLLWVDVFGIAYCTLYEPDGGLLYRVLGV